MLVKFHLAILPTSLGLTYFMIHLQSSTDYDFLYRDKLAKIYNTTQGKPNDYLDALHSQFQCCGTFNMELNMTGDPRLFQPYYDMIAPLPKSCCPVLDENDQCTSPNIYKTPCDVRKLEKERVLNFVVGSLLIVSFLWKIVFHFIYNRSDSLFVNL